MFGALVNLLKDLVKFTSGRASAQDLVIEIDQAQNYLSKYQKTEAEGFKARWVKFEKYPRLKDEGWEEFSFWKGKGIKKQKVRLRTTDGMILLINKK